MADLDGDGDMEIVSICWDDYQNLHLWRNDALKPEATGMDSENQAGELYPACDYYLPVEINTGNYERYNKPAELTFNFTQLMHGIDKSKTFDDYTIRIVEVNAKGFIIDNSVDFQIDKAIDYDSMKRALVTVTFILEGIIPAHTSRYFHILLIKTQGDKPIETVSSKINFTDDIEYEKQLSYKIETQNATYYYHKRGSGFASMIDREGNDWISYRPTGGSAGNYRGIPNIYHGSFHPGPGEENKLSRILNKGPLKVSILSESKDGKWGCIWDIFPHYARMNLFKKGDETFWILYEGTPGGSLDAETDYWVKSSGEKMIAAQDWDGELPNPEWVYFGDGKMQRVLYMIHHEDDNKPDQFWQMQHNMTVFGFGREFKGMGTYMTTAPTHLTIGFAENGSFPEASKVINSAYRELIISAGSLEVMGE